MAFICITPNVAMVRMNARDHLEELPGDFYINLDMLVEARMKEVREDHDGDFCADVLLVLKNKTHEFVFRICITAAILGLIYTPFIDTCDRRI